MSAAVEKLDDFDLGNSPAECIPERVRGKRLFMSTTNGTRALERVRRVPILFDRFAHQSRGGGALFATRTTAHGVDCGGRLARRVFAGGYDLRRGDRPLAQRRTRQRLFRG